MPTLWMVDLTSLPRPTGKRRKIGRKPLIDLAGLQQAIAAGKLGNDDVWLATTKAEHNLEDLAWSFEDVLVCIGHLDPADFRGAEWCDDKRGKRHPCDAYAIHYDHIARRRVQHMEMNYYLKFSIQDDGALTLVLVSCHL